MNKVLFEEYINGIPVRASYTEENVREIFLPLLSRWTEMQRKKGSRLLVMLAAPPAAGKSTLAAFLEKLSKETEGITPLTAVGMDGFHYHREYLASHTAVRDGNTVPLSAVKGSPESFDIGKLRAQIHAFQTGGGRFWPYYDRQIHDPVEDAVEVSGEIVLLEGNYLLLDAPGWRDLREEADDTLRILVREEDVRERLIVRKAATGNMSREEAERFVDFSDLRNVRTCMAHFLPAATTLLLTGTEDRAVFVKEENTADEGR